MLQRPLWKPDHVRTREVVRVRHCTRVDVGGGLPGGGDSKLQGGFRTEAMGQRLSGGGRAVGPGGQLPSPAGLAHTLMLPQD